MAKRAPFKHFKTSEEIIHLATNGGEEAFLLDAAGSASGGSADFAVIQWFLLDVRFVGCHLTPECAGMLWRETTISGSGWTAPITARPYTIGPQKSPM